MYRSSDYLDLANLASSVEALPLLRCYKRWQTASIRGHSYDQYISCVRNFAEVYEHVLVKFGWCLLSAHRRTGGAHRWTS